MAKVPSDLNQVFETLVHRRHCLAFLKGLHVPGFSVTLPSQPLLLIPAAVSSPRGQSGGLHRSSGNG